MMVILPGMLTEASYIPIQSLDIEAETRISFDIYINLPLNNKYILYRKSGSLLEADKRDFLNSKNVANFFIQKEDYGEFVKYVAGRLQILLSSQDSIENRRLMLTSAKAILSSTFNATDPTIANALMGNLNDITSVVIEGILDGASQSKKRIFQKLSLLAEKGTDFQKHPVNVASLAVLLTFGIGYSNEKTLSDIAIAALLHDLGLSKLPPKVAASAHDLSKLGLYEKDWLRSHPQIAIEILAFKKIEISELTKTIILQHHEEYNGLGYPDGIKGYAVNEMAQILRISDDLEQLFKDEFKTGGELKARVTSLIDKLHRSRSVEPNLLGRIRDVLI